MGTGTTAGHDDVVEIQTHFEHLLHGFLATLHIAESTDGIGCASRDDIGLLALCSELLGNLLHLFGHVAATLDHGDALYAKELVQEVVTGRLGVVAVGNALFQNKVAIQTFLDRPRQGKTAVVGLDSTAGDDGISALGKSICNGEVQLASLVASTRSGEEVVTFYVDIYLATKSFGETGQILNRSRLFDITTTRKLRKIHYRLLVFWIGEWIEKDICLLYLVGNGSVPLAMPTMAFAKASAASTTGRGYFASCKMPSSVHAIANASAPCSQTSAITS